MVFERKFSLEGFTLIELTIVMAIIAVLATFSIVTFAGSQVKARDGRRKAELRQLQNALEAYYNDNKSYPVKLCASYERGGQGSNCWTDGLASSFLGGVNSKNYINSMPIDPKNTGSDCGSKSTYAYVYNSSADGQTYYLFTQLENANDPSISGSNATNKVVDTGVGCSAFANYEVKSP